MLTGSIPASLSRLTLLDRIFLDTNQLTGHIPEVSDLQDLISISVSKNSLTGTFPTAIWTLTALEYILAYQTHISGSISSSVSGGT